MLFARPRTRQKRLQDNLGIFVITQLSKPKDDADRRKPEVNYLGGRTVRVIPDSPKARNVQIMFEATDLPFFRKKNTAFSIYLGLRTVKDIPDCPKPREMYLGLRAVSMPAEDIA